MQKLNVGDRVRVKKYDNPREIIGWVYDMNEFVGQEFTIIDAREVKGFDVYDDHMVYMLGGTKEYGFTNGMLEVVANDQARDCKGTCRG